MRPIAYLFSLDGEPVTLEDQIRYSISLEQQDIFATLWTENERFVQMALDNPTPGWNDRSERDHELTLKGPDGALYGWSARGRFSVAGVGCGGNRPASYNLVFRGEIEQSGWSEKWIFTELNNMTRYTWRSMYERRWLSEEEE